MDIVPVFITVDPERDTVEQVRDYVKGVSVHLCPSIPNAYDHLKVVFI